MSSWPRKAAVGLCFHANECMCTEQGHEPCCGQFRALVHGVREAEIKSIDENADLLQRLDRWKEGDSNTRSLIRWAAAHLRGEQDVWPIELRTARGVVALLHVPPVCCPEDNTYNGGAENFRGTVLEILERMIRKACPNHEPNGGPGSDQCMQCGQYK